MRKTIAIFFTLLYLFNLAGYKLIFNYLIQINDQETVQQIDNDEYSESNLLEIKVPLTLPYAVNWNEYERFDGEIELDGIRYNFVKRKWNHDTLYVMCLPNDTKTELHKAKNFFTAQDYTNKSNSSSKKDANTSLKKINIETACRAIAAYEFRQVEYNSDNYKISIPPQLSITFVTSCFRPPKNEA